MFIIFSKITLAPALKPSKAPPALLKWICVNFGQYIPRHIEISNLDLKGLSNDPTVLENYKNDPFVHDKISMQLAKDVFHHADFLIANASKCTFPLCLYHAKDDLLTDCATSLMFMEKVGSTDKTTKVIEHCGHECKFSYSDYQKICYNLVKCIMKLEI